MSYLERTLIEFWLILRDTPAQIQQRPQLLDSVGAPRFTLGEIEGSHSARLKQSLDKSAPEKQPRSRRDPVSSDYGVVDVDQAPANQQTLTTWEG